MEAATFEYLLEEGEDDFEYAIEGEPNAILLRAKRDFAVARGVTEIVDVMPANFTMPEGYEACILPAPCAARAGVVALMEPILQDSRFRAMPSTVMVNFAANMGHMWYSPREFVRVSKGQIVAVLRVSRRSPPIVASQKVLPKCEKRKVCHVATRTGDPQEFLATNDKRRRDEEVILVRPDGTGARIDLGAPDESPSRDVVDRDPDTPMNDGSDPDAPMNDDSDPDVPTTEDMPRAFTAQITDGTPTPDLVDVEVTETVTKIVEAPAEDDEFDSDDQSTVPVQLRMIMRPAFS